MLIFLLPGLVIYCLVETAEVFFLLFSLCVKLDLWTLGNIWCLGHFLKNLSSIFQYNWILFYFYFHLWREYFLLGDFRVEAVSLFLHGVVLDPRGDLAFLLPLALERSVFWRFPVLSEYSSVFLYILLKYLVLWDTFLHLFPQSYEFPTFNLLLLNYHDISLGNTSLSIAGLEMGLKSLAIWFFSVSVQFLQLTQLCLEVEFFFG